MSVVILTGCSSGKNTVDPYESYNRAIFKFNKVVDTIILKPTTIGYQYIVPKLVRQGVSNVFDNAFLTANLCNDLLQGELVDFGMDFWRLLINTTIGIGGLFDVAKHIGFPKKHKDFGMTLYKWGDRDSPFLVLPFFGPSTVRDGVGILIDYNIFSVIPYVKPPILRNSIYGLQMIDVRNRLLEADDLVEAASLDEYLFTRNAYLQYRKSLILASDDNPDNDEDDDDDPFVE